MMMRAALGYAARGWSVFPLDLDKKAPLGKLVRHGVAHATTDPDVIEYWWTRCKAANIGIACSKFLAVDIDPRNRGDVQLRALLNEHGPFPTTPTQRTGGGGVHYLFKCPAVALVGKLPPGIDLVWGTRRYIVGAPSIVSDGRYEWTTPPTVPLAEAPAWLIAMGRRPEPRATVASVSSGKVESNSERVARGRRYAERLEPAVSGQGGSTATIIVCAKLVHTVGLTAAEAFAALSEWNKSCKPPWSESELRRKIDHAINGNSKQRRTA